MFVLLTQFCMYSEPCLVLACLLFRATAPQLLEDMLEEVKHVRHLRRHHLHVLLTPLLTNWSSHGIGDILIAFRLLSIRCKVNIQSGCYCVCVYISNVSQAWRDINILSQNVVSFRVARSVCCFLHNRISVDNLYGI